MSDDTISLPRLPAALRELTGAEPPDYRQLWHLAVTGRFPISMIRGRYQIRRGDLPEIAKKPGLPNHTPAPKAGETVTA